MRRTLRGLMSAPTGPFSEYAPQAAWIKGLPAYVPASPQDSFSALAIGTAFRAKTHQRAGFNSASAGGRQGEEPKPVSICNVTLLDGSKVE